MAAGPGRYSITFSNPARKAFDALPRPVQERIRPRIDALAEELRPHGVEKLAGHEDRYRIRIGDYRVVYSIVDDRLTVLVVRVGHRRDVYRGDG